MIVTERTGGFDEGPGLYAAGSHGGGGHSWLESHGDFIGANGAVCSHDPRKKRNGGHWDGPLQEGECCEDQTPARVRCKWKIERVELPDPPTFDEMNPAGDGAGLDLSTPNTDLSSGMPGGAGALGVLANLGTSGGSALQSGGGIGALGSMLGDASGGVAGLAPMVMSIVYPSLKPMLEASIRKISVTVLWKEGINDRELAVVQYVTNPMRGGLGMGMEGAETDLLSGAFGPSESGATEPSGRTPRVSPMATSRGK